MRLWRRRPREVDVYLPVARIEHLFEAPARSEWECYDPGTGLERMARAVRWAAPMAAVSVTVGLPFDVIHPDVHAISREGRRRIAVLEDELRFGIRALLHLDHEACGHRPTGHALADCGIMPGE